VLKVSSRKYSINKVRLNPYKYLFYLTYLIIGSLCSISLILFIFEESVSVQVSKNKSVNK